MSTANRVTTPFNAQSTAPRSSPVSTSSAAARSSPAARPASASRPPAPSPAPAPTSPSPCATRRRASGQRPTSATPSPWRSSICQTARRWRRSPPTGLGPLHTLVNNAGVMASPLMRTAEGWEMQFATNHLGHFGLATGLHDALAAAGDARVVSVSSSAHLRSGIVFDDIMFKRRQYEPWSAYGQSKTANVLFAVEASHRWAGDGITVNALHPGGIRTQLQRYVSEEELDRLRAATGTRQPNWKTPEQGAATSTMLAASSLIEGVSGRYFEGCNEAGPNERGTRTGVAAHALDPEAAARLWDVSVTYLAN
ncbi:MAG TPA: SDR family NAD(P)-dependent oxidoreductase [Solirubrobacteraceae bacterium]|nr:SDR family NAD(P)-dependent oxidoreductase [Solirubrobacteraceae bacterium]